MIQANHLTKRFDEHIAVDAVSLSVDELADSSVNLAVRPHCHPDHYWDVFFEVNESMKNALEANSISIPFPLRDVHLNNV